MDEMAVEVEVVPVVAVEVEVVPVVVVVVVTASDPLTATSSSFRQSNCLHMDGVLLVFQAQLFGTACRIVLETTHYPMIRSGAISKPTCTFLHVTNQLETP